MKADFCSDHLMADKPTYVTAQTGCNTWFTPGIEYAVRYWRDDTPWVRDNDEEDMPLVRWIAFEGARPAAPSPHVQSVSVSDTPDYREPPAVELTFGPPPDSGTAAHGILTEAADIVKGARNATHGDKERSFAVIANLWNSYLEGRRTGGPITGRDVAACMVLLKLARSVQGTPHRDHFVDAAGYAAIAGELA